jgi:hypothetical protein
MEIEQIIEKILAKENPNTEPLSLEDYQAIYFTINGRDPSFKWIIVVLGDSAIIQPLGCPHITLTIQSNHYYKKADFNFTTSNVSVVGALQGKYTFRHFLVDVFSVKEKLMISFVFVACSFLSLLYLASDVIKVISESLLTSLSVFLPLISFFVFNEDIKHTQKFISTDKFHILSQSDKYIGVLGLISLILCLCSTTTSNIYEYQSIPRIYNLDWQRIIQVLFFSLSVLTSLTCFYLVVNYHFQRKNELHANEMAMVFLKTQQTLYANRITKKND